jgi:SAM-dependent methyltransferase
MDRLSQFVQTRLLPHDWVYDAAYYDETVDGPARESAVTIAATIVRDLRPECVLDVGCGTGAMLEALANLGCAVMGFERSRAALDLARSRNLAVIEFDLNRCDVRPERGDVVISMEVAEHLPQRVDEQYVELLTTLAPVIVFTAATPGQGGTSHVNEQPHKYWEEKFRRRRFVLNRELTSRWQEQWMASGSVAEWYWRNLMVFNAIRQSGQFDDGRA